MFRKISVSLLLAAIIAVPSSAAQLVADFRFENGANLGEDSSSQANHGTVVGTVNQVAGRSASTRAATFDGATSRIEVLGGLNGYDGQPGFSFAAWVYLDPATTGFDGVISQDAGACCTHRLLLDPTHTPLINVGVHDDRSVGTALPTGTWFHIVM